MLCHFDTAPQWCSYAHKLYELSLMPASAYMARKRGDRWIGQKLDAAQIDMFKVYYNQSNEWERPTWAKGLMWYIDNAPPDDFKECPWDFDLTGDSTMFRNSALFYGDLWTRLYEREKKLKGSILFVSVSGF